MISSILILVVAFLSLIILMIIHEFGHFIIAKKFGVRVDEFGIGYPPRIFGNKIGETIYSINWIPLVAGSTLGSSLSIGEVWIHQPSPLCGEDHRDSIDQLSSHQNLRRRSDQTACIGNNHSII